MLTPATNTDAPNREEVPAPQWLLTTELDFYEAYGWCLDPYPTVQDAIKYLRTEIDRLQIGLNVWQTGEVATNIFLLSCGLLNAVEEYLRGPTLWMPRQLAATRLGRGARWATEGLTGLLRQRRRAQARRWQERWVAGLDDFLAIAVDGQSSDSASFAELGGKLAMLLLSPLPPDLQTEHIGVPTPFRRLDLTHFDVLALGQRLRHAFPIARRQSWCLGCAVRGPILPPCCELFSRPKAIRAYPR